MARKTRGGISKEVSEHHVIAGGPVISPSMHISEVSTALKKSAWSCGAAPGLQVSLHSNPLGSMPLGLPTKSAQLPNCNL